MRFWPRRTKKVYREWTEESSRVFTVYACQVNEIGTLRDARGFVWGLLTMVCGFGLGGARECIRISQRVGVFRD